MISKKTMAETMAEQLREAVLAGVWSPGSALPTEPELAVQFGVSRAVVRDATRIISAWGLVEARQGKGVYVTADQAAGFGTALLLALRRNGATVWDVEEFERLIFPETAAMIAGRPGKVNFGLLRKRLDDYGLAIKAQVKKNPGGNWFTGGAREAWFLFADTMFEMTGNKVMAQLGPAIARIRNARSFEGEQDRDPELVSRRETDAIASVLSAVESGNPDRARSVTSKLLNLPAKAVDAMKQTVVGEVPQIPMDLEVFLEDFRNEDNRGQ